MKKRMILPAAIIAIVLLTFFISFGGAASVAKIVFSKGTTMTVKSGGTVTADSGSTVNLSGTNTLKTGGTLTADSGSTVTLNGTTNAVKGVSTGYALARGSVTYTGSTAVNTGLTSIVSATASINTSGAGGVLPSVVTVSPSSGTLTLKCWNATSSVNNTLITGTTENTVYWVAVGTK